MLLGLIFGVVLFSNIQFSESLLWDLQIFANPEKESLTLDEFPIIVGLIVDHAEKPIPEAEVKLRVGTESVTTFTNTAGEFRYEFNNAFQIPGMYVVNIVATSTNGKIGLGNTNFKIIGEVSLASVIAKNLGTQEAFYYLNAHPDDFKYDPIGMSLYNHYQKMKSEYVVQNEIEQKQAEHQIMIEESRKLAEESLQNALDDELHGVGVYEGWRYDIFVSNLDLSVRDTIVDQLNYTANALVLAQAAMQTILDDGGTMEEARQAYIDAASISRDSMYKITYGDIDEIDQLSNDNSTSDFNSNQTSSINDEIILNQNNDEQISVNGTTIDVQMNGNFIYVIVNGTIIEFFINGTEILPTNSSMND